MVSQESPITGIWSSVIPYAPLPLSRRPAPRSMSLPLVPFSTEGDLTAGPGHWKLRTGNLGVSHLRTQAGERISAHSAWTLRLHGAERGGRGLWAPLPAPSLGALSLGKCFSISDLRVATTGGKLNVTRWCTVPGTGGHGFEATEHVELCGLWRWEQRPSPRGPLLHIHGQALCKLFARRWHLVW